MWFIFYVRNVISEYYLKHLPLSACDLFWCWAVCSLFLCCGFSHPLFPFTPLLLLFLTGTIKTHQSAAILRFIDILTAIHKAAGTGLKTAMLCPVSYQHSQAINQCNYHHMYRTIVRHAMLEINVLSLSLSLNLIGLS